MKTKLTMIALLFCSSLSLAQAPLGTGTRPAPEEKKKATVIVPASTDSAQKVDETVFGGLGTRGTAAPQKKAPQPRK